VRRSQAGICSPMAYLHAPINGKPTVHRDIKPENLMININYQVVKLIDFGLAKETISGVGSTMNMKGTDGWMAPEQRLSGGCSVNSDMYAVALVSTFIWRGKTPQEQPPELTRVAEIADPRANFTQQLMPCCHNPDPKHRPSAAFVSFKFDNVIAPSVACEPEACAESAATSSPGNVGSGVAQLDGELMGMLREWDLVHSSDALAIHGFKTKHQMMWMDL
jgi:serine/threonine protein kinase